MVYIIPRVEVALWLLIVRSYLKFRSDLYVEHMRSNNHRDNKSKISRSAPADADADDDDDDVASHKRNNKLGTLQCCMQCEQIRQNFTKLAQF